MKEKANDISGACFGPALSRFFSSKVLRELARTGHSRIAAGLLREYRWFSQFESKMSVSEFYDTIFDCLLREYRDEYIYKNAIAEKILLGKHNLSTAFMLTELRVDDCKADAVVLNGTSHVYEIKSEMDSFDRLDRQLSAYQKMFDFVTVITTERLYKAVSVRAPKEIGIMVLADGKYQFKRKDCYRKASSNKSNVIPSVIFNSLQRREYLKIIKDVFGISLAHLPNTEIYREAKLHFEKLTPEVAHDAMVQALKHRRDVKRISDFIIDVPNSLKAASLSVRLTREERDRFIGLLNKDIASTFA